MQNYKLMMADGRCGGIIAASSLDDAMAKADVMEVPEWFDWDGAYVDPPEVRN